MSEVRARLLHSSRSLEDVICRAELDGEEVVHTLTRAQTPGWTAAAASATTSTFAKHEGSSAIKVFRASRPTGNRAAHVARRAPAPGLEDGR